MFASSIWTMQHTSSKDILEYNNYMTIVQVVPKTTRSTTEMEMIESSRFYLFNVFNELRAALTKPDKDHDSFISKDFAKIWIGKKEVKCYLEKVDRFSVIAMGQDHPVVKEQFKFWKTF